MRRSWLLACAVGTAVVAMPALQAPLPDAPDKAGLKWVEDTFKKMTLDDKVGQLVVTSTTTTYLSSDTDAYDALVAKAKQLRLGGIHLFGGAEPVPAVLLNNAYGSVILGQPLAAASLMNRLQNAAAIPLLNTGDFEAGLGFRISGATAFPRQMAVGAAGDETQGILQREHPGPARGHVLAQAVADHGRRTDPPLFPKLRQGVLDGEDRGVSENRAAQAAGRLVVRLRLLTDASRRPLEVRVHARQHPVEVASVEGLDDLAHQLDADHPYNTRTRTGLPPTPIANPGLASLEAAASPARTDFLYFLRRPGSQEHFFTASEAEFYRKSCEFGYGC